MPIISVIMPVFNSEEFVKEAIDSILCQTFTDFELLALDDGSTDLSAEIIKSFEDPRIKYILCPHDFISTLNYGLALAQGKYIARMDSDDLMVADRLRIQFEFMEKHLEIAACGGYMETFGRYTQIIRVLTDHDDIILNMLLGNTMANPTGFIRKSILVDYNISHEYSYLFAEDYKLWSEIAKVGKLANIPQVLTKYRISNNQTTSTHYDSMMAATVVIQTEMLDYFLEHFEPVEELGFIVANNLISSIKKLNNSGFFSKEVYFNFMYELIIKLRKDGNFTL